MDLEGDKVSPLLWRACLAGDVPSMEGLLARGADPAVKDRNGENCLHMAARSGEVDAVERMADEGIPLNSANHNGQTPLHVAVYKDHMGIVRYLVRCGANVDLTTQFSGMTGLHVACRENNEDMVQFLLDNGANCAITDKIGSYPDVYTQDKKVLDIFHTHFPTCTHGRMPGQVTASQMAPGLLITPSHTMSSDSHALTASGDGPGVSVRKSQRQEGGDGNDRTPPSHERREHDGKGIYDKMEKYNVDRAQQNWELARKEAKKIKVNHGMGFSDQHKQRMQQNVFDRLLGGKKTVNK